MTSKKKRKKKKGPSPQKGITNERLADKLKRILREKKISKEEFARKLDEPLPYILSLIHISIIRSAISSMISCRRSVISIMYRLLRFA